MTDTEFQILQSDVSSLQNQLVDLENQFANQTMRNIADKFGITQSVFISGTNAQTATNYGQFFIAPFPMNVLFVGYKHIVAGTGNGTIKLQSSANSSGTLTDLLVDSSNADTSFDTTKAANTVFFASGTNTGIANQVANLKLQSTPHLNTFDSLTLTTSGTLTTLQSVTITVYLGATNSGRYRIYS